LKIRSQPPIQPNDFSRTQRQAALRSEVPGREHSSFAPGQTVTGRVLGSGKDGQLLLEINGRTVSAYATRQLPVGEELQFIVSRGGEVPWLSIQENGPVQQIFRLLAGDFLASLAGTAKTAAHLENIIDSPSLSPFGATLQSLLPMLAVSADTPLDSVLLSVLLFNPAIGNRQSFFQLPDEKALQAMLEKIGKTDSAVSPTQRKALANLTQLGRLLDLGAEVNRQALLQDNPRLLVFPLFYAGNAGWGEWLLRFEDHEACPDGSRSSKISLDFFLNMSNLGQLQLSLQLADKNLQGVFLLQDRRAADYLQGHLQELKDRLEKIGYSVPSLSCVVMRQSNQAALKSVIEECSNISNLSLIDLKA